MATGDGAAEVFVDLLPRRHPTNSAISMTTAITPQSTFHVFIRQHLLCQSETQSVTCLDKKQGARWEATQRPAGREGRDDDRGREWEGRSMLRPCPYYCFLAVVVFFAAVFLAAGRRWRVRRVRR